MFLAVSGHHELEKIGFSFFVVRPTSRLPLHTVVTVWLLGIANSEIFNIAVNSISFIVTPLYPIKLLESSAVEGL